MQQYFGRKRSFCRAMETVLDERPAALVVDDSRTSLGIISKFLIGAGYETLTATDGAEALEVIHKHAGRIGVLVVDRVMPKMDGLELTHHVKNDPELEHIPIIMQTASGTREEILTGIQAGVHHYVVKPFKRDLLVSLVDSAVGDYIRHCRLRAELLIHQKTVDLILLGKFRFRTMEHCDQLAAFLANACPDPSRRVTGLVELLNNAVEHGNLGITYEEKSAHMNNGTLTREIESRLAAAKYRDRWATIDIENNGAQVSFTIRDHGQGFDWRKYMEIDPSRAFDSHGRGIAYARLVSFDELSYEGVGNVAHCSVNLAAAARQAA